MALRGVLRRGIFDVRRELVSYPRMIEQRLGMDEAYREGMRHGKMGLRPALSMRTPQQQEAYSRGFRFGLRLYKQSMTTRYPMKPSQRAKNAPTQMDAIGYLKRTSKNLDDALR